MVGVIKQAIRFAIIAGVWRRYKTAIVSTFLLLAFWFLLSFFHGEYLSYADSTRNMASVGLSFFIKWGLGLLGLLIFLAYHYTSIIASKAGSDASAREGKLSTAETPPKPDLGPRPPKPGDSDYRKEQDPFSQLRDKSHLRSLGDFEIEKSKTKPPKP